MQRVLACFLVLVLLLPAALAETANVKVFRVGEAEPFDPDEILMEVYVAPISGADCMVILSGGESMLIDMGQDFTYEDVRPFLLERLGLTQIDYAFNTHPHVDHLGGMVQMLDDIHFDHFLTAFDEDYFGYSVIQQETMPYIHAAGIPVTRVHNEDQMELGNATLTFYQQFEYGNSANSQSCVMMAEVGDCRILFGADIEIEEENYLARCYDMEADILKYPHHGLNQLGLIFAEEVNPEYVIITGGCTMTELGQQAIRWLVHDFDWSGWGVIHLATNGEYWLVEQELKEEAAKFWVDRYPKFPYYH